MPRENYKPKRWDLSELIQILSYINTHFELWYENPHVACTKSMETTKTSRGIKSVYGKVHRMIKVMDDYLKTGKKSCDMVIWEDKRIYEMLEKICTRFNERKGQESESSTKKGKKRGRKRRNELTGGIEKDTIIINGNVVMNKKVKLTTSIEEAPQTTNEEPRESREIAAGQLNLSIPSVPFSVEMIDELYNKQIQKAEHHVQELLNLSKNSIDVRYKEVRDLTAQIFQRQSELKKMIDEVNDKVEKLKDFKLLKVTM
ncbi:2601_t:CDS:2 [Funneliformis geosporum]|uniref:1914_t:CDS:1 n=1 Tax=Funneliformis geosporum TaxID=1117311 RepID=A0A9W4WRY1_9GLOM|nr:1914_t:CDS:2 [Funneliformis geosporum]CAI2170362.1 2601_t:CDS:2 [Funneliformis geosporum]